MKKLSQLFILALLLLVSSCDMPWCKRDFSGRVQIYYANRMSREYGAMYEHSTSPVKPLDYLVQLPEFTPFEWDTLIWVSDSLKPEDITKIIGTRYEDESAYKGKRKLIFMNDGKVVDIYALKKGDEFSLIPGDEQDGYAGISRDTWFTVRANDTTFVLKRFGVSNIYTPKAINGDSVKKEPLFEIDYEEFTFGLSSDTVESKREHYSYGGVNFDMSPLIKKMVQSVFTESQISQIKKDKFLVAVIFRMYIDTGEVFECYWNVEDRYENLFSKKQWEQLSEIMLNIRIDPRLLEQPQKWFEWSKEKRIFCGWAINVTYSIID